MLQDKYNEKKAKAIEKLNIDNFPTIENFEKHFNLTINF